MKIADFTFIDLFAGIGGFHLALKRIGGECVFASEIDKKAKDVYLMNFPNTNMHGDIYECLDKIPKFDVLTGGFPCQSFSHAGNQKGFEDERNGNFFFAIVDILKKHPECKAFILENVKQISHAKYWTVIQEELSKLNFHITTKPIILSPTDFGVPHNRPRVFIVGIRKDIAVDKDLDKYLATYQYWINDIIFDIVSLIEEKPFVFSDDVKETCKQLGNSVNVKVVMNVAIALFSNMDWDKILKENNINKDDLQNVLELI